MKLRSILPAAALGLLLACGGAAQAQIYPNPSPTPIAPTWLHGHCNVVIPAGVSTALNGPAMNCEPNGAPFPTGVFGNPLLGIESWSTSASAIIYVCWHGGTCSAAVGWPVEQGRFFSNAIPGQNMSTQPPTIYAPSGATVTEAH